jgi:hypothetical protein
LDLSADKFSEIEKISGGNRGRPQRAAFLMVSEKKDKMQRQRHCSG